MRMTGMRMNLASTALFALCASLVLAACQSGPPKISIEGARAELSPAVVGEAMVSMQIRNDCGTDTIGGVKTDIAGANVSMHGLEGKRMVTIDMEEVMKKSTLEFKMDGTHIMISDMPKTMKEGSKFDLVLVFQKSGEVRVPLTLQSAGAMPMGHDHAM